MLKKKLNQSNSDTVCISSESHDKDRNAQEKRRRRKKIYDLFTSLNKISLHAQFIRFSIHEENLLFLLITRNFPVSNEILLHSCKKFSAKVSLLSGKEYVSFFSFFFKKRKSNKNIIFFSSLLKSKRNVLAAVNFS